MKKLLLVCFLFFMLDAFGLESAPCGDYGDCKKFSPQLNNLESLQLGASTFINYCYGCHSLKYSRWGRVATDLDIPEEILLSHLAFGEGIKPGDTYNFHLDLGRYGNNSVCNLDDDQSNFEINEVGGIESMEAVPWIIFEDDVVNCNDRKLTIV